MFKTHTRLDKFVNDLFDSHWDQLSWKTTYERYLRLPVVSRDNNGVEIKLTLPGYERDDLEISIEDNILTVETVKDHTDDVTPFTKQFELFEDIDVKTCEAKMKAGILTILFKYKKNDKKNKIIVK